MESSEKQTDQPVINISGEKVTLGPVRRDLLPVYLRWVNDFEVLRSLSMRMRPSTWEAEEAWYERVCKSDEGNVQFTIYELSSMRPIGGTGLHEIDHFHRTAEFGIMIGEKECWGKGYGTETAGLMLDYGFTALGLHSIMLHVYEFNERAVRAYARAGFREVGRLRESHYAGGCYYDVILMDCLATEFESRALR